MIYLVAPGLLGPFPRFVEPGEVPPLPALQTLLARADRIAGPAGYAAVLFQLFGMADADAETACSLDAGPRPKSGKPRRYSPGLHFAPSGLRPITEQGGGQGLREADLPTAPLCHLADSGDAGESRCLLHADPIYLRPDQDRLLAFDFHRQPLEPDEANAFVAAFNAHFAEDGLELLAPHPTRWYLAVDECPQAQFQPLSEILGRNIDLFLPEGPDARRWRAWLNEIQMLFHGLPVNAEREAQRRWPVSGLWFSGAGRLPQVPGGRVRPDAEAMRCPLVGGLSARAEQTGGESLVVVHGPGRAVLEGDFEAWSQTMLALDRQLGGLMKQELRLYSCDGRVWHWRPAHRWRLWRRRGQATGLFVGA